MVASIKRTFCVPSDVTDIEPDNESFVCHGDHEKCIETCIVNGDSYVEIIAGYYGFTEHIPRIAEAEIEMHWYGIYIAIKYGNFITAKAMVDSGTTMASDCLELAVEKGNFELVRYLVSRGCPVSFRAANAAAENGHITCLKFLYEHGAEISDTTATLAAQNGHYECMKFLYDEGKRVMNGFESWVSRTEGTVECADICIEELRKKYASEKDRWILQTKFDNIIQVAVSNGNEAIFRKFGNLAARDFRDELIRDAIKMKRYGILELMDSPDYIGSMNKDDFYRMNHLFNEIKKSESIDTFLLFVERGFRPFFSHRRGYPYQRYSDEQIVAFALQMVDIQTILHKTAEKKYRTMDTLFRRYLATCRPGPCF